MAERLLAPELVDRNARGAAYLVTVQAQLQPAWGQFLEDCRTRLPPEHALNVMTREATIELVLDRNGKLAIGKVEGSGDPDFDRAARGVIGDATFPAPPVELLGDDDHVHLAWMFARDRRQAGAATASIVDVALPIDEVVDRMLANNELERAARRVMIAQAPAAARRVMIAALRQALASDLSTSSVRFAVIEAIGRGQVGELANEVRARLQPTTSLELRVVAMIAAAALKDRESIPLLVAQLATDIDDPRLAVSEVSALVALGEREVAAQAIAGVLEKAKTPPYGALGAFAQAPTPTLGAKIAGWFDRGDPRTRAAVCGALAGIPEAHASTIARGLRDADATVRAICVDVAVMRERAKPSPATMSRLRELAHDRDRLVRARAVAALVTLAPNTPPKLAPDDPAEVRAAFAAAHPANVDDVLRTLAADPDDSVRAAALEALDGRAPELVEKAVYDQSSAVRLAAVGALADEAVLEKLMSDSSPEVAMAASIRLATKRGRAAMTRSSLDRLAASQPASPERIRAILAWLLAP